MKKIISVLLIVLMSLSITGCSSKVEETSVSNEPQTKTSYFEENGFVDSGMITDLAINWVTKFSNEDFDEVYEGLEGMTLDNHGTLNYSILSIETESSDKEGYEKVVMNMEYTGEIDFIQDETCTVEHFWFLNNYSGDFLFDYDTGERLTNGLSLKVGTDEAEKSFTINKDGKEITIYMTSARENRSEWSGWGTDDGFEYYDLYYYDMYYTLTIEKPTDYDGVVLAILNDSIENLTDSMLDKEDLDYKYILDEGSPASDYHCLVLKNYTK